jgi:UDP-N-acetylmuramate dehydrogenase
MKYLKNEPLKKHTSFRIGGSTQWLLVPRDEEELASALNFAQEHKLPITILGAGTNVLALDKGFAGLAIKMAGGMNQLRFEGNTLEVGAGVFLPKLLAALLARRLSGLEFLAGIPGTIGGALVMNAGGWGKGIGTRVVSVKVLDHQGKFHILQKKDLHFGYRRSCLQRGNFIVTSAVLKLRKGNRQQIKNKIKEYLEIRKSSQPLGIPNAGSIFKNPHGKFAGKLIEEAGLKGVRIGDAQVSTKHANFIVNLGEATSHDVIRLITRIQKLVNDRFKIKLEPEIKIMVKSPR